MKILFPFEQSSIDSYCKIDVDGKFKKTRIVRNTYAPEWHEYFVFKVRFCSNVYGFVSAGVVLRSQVSGSGYGDWTEHVLAPVPGSGSTHRVHWTHLQCT